MKMLENLKIKNEKLQLYSMRDKEFLKYGRIINSVNSEKLIEVAEKIEMPSENSLYNASQPQFEQIPGLCREYSEKVYGEMPVQIGFCYGYNSYLNGLEWHKGNEINVAVTDFVLLLGNVFDIKNGKYNSSNVEGFFIEKGTSVEIFSTTLHFCPCQTQDCGFKSVVVLPRGTNLTLESDANDRYLYCKNKWIIAHEENSKLIQKGVFGGICGENLKLFY